MAKRLSPSRRVRVIGRTGHITWMPHSPHGQQNLFMSGESVGATSGTAHNGDTVESVDGEDNECKGMGNDERTDMKRPGICYPCFHGMHENCYGSGRWNTCVCSHDSVVPR